jgi:hypothetical protein
MTEVVVAATAVKTFASLSASCVVTRLAVSRESVAGCTIPREVSECFGLFAGWAITHAGWNASTFADYLAAFGRLALPICAVSDGITRLAIGATAVGAPRRAREVVQNL